MLMLRLFKESHSISADCAVLQCADNARLVPFDAGCNDGVFVCALGGF